jgi:hypothetical protein
MNCFGFVFVSLVWAWGSKAWADAPKSEETATGYFYADIVLFSYQPGNEINTYRGYGGVSGVGPNGTTFLSATGKDRNFEVRLTGRLKSPRQFFVSVKISPERGDTQTKAQETEYDLSGLNPQSLEIVKDDSGRVYKLNLTPRIIEFPTVKQFKVSDFQLQSWGFPSSPVIVNDQDYIGEMSVSSGPLAWCDIPGLAKVEFSLLHLKDATPTGALKDGVINIRHSDGTTLKISNVKNGAHGEILPGGPYQVWVRWNKPTQTLEEFHEVLKQEIEALREKSKTGDYLRPEILERLEKMSRSDRAGLISFGVHQLDKDDLADPGK